MLLYYYFYLKKVATHHQNFDRDGNWWANSMISGLAKANWSRSRRNHSCGDTLAYNNDTRSWIWGADCETEHASRRIYENSRSLLKSTWSRRHSWIGFFWSRRGIRPGRLDATVQRRNVYSIQFTYVGVDLIQQQKHDRAHAGRSEGELESLGAKGSTNERCYVCAFY